MGISKFIVLPNYKICFPLEFFNPFEFHLVESDPFNVKVKEICCSLKAGDTSFQFLRIPISNICPWWLDFAWFQFLTYLGWKQFSVDSWCHMHDTRQMFLCLLYSFNTLRPRRNEQHFADDIFKRIFFNGNVWISIKVSLKFVPKGPINNIPALVQIMAWRRPGDKPLSEPMMVRSTTHICVTRPQWLNMCINHNVTVAVSWLHHRPDWK